MAKKQSASKKVRKKKWFPVIAPKILGEKVLGESLLIESSLMKGKYMSMNLMNITGDPKKQNTNLQFRIKDVKEGRGIAEIVKFERINSFMKRLVRRGRTKIDDSFIVRTSQGQRARIKTIVISNGQVSKAVATRIRQTIREHLKNSLKANTFQKTVEELLKGQFMKETKTLLNKAAPVRTFDVRVFKLEAKRGEEEKQIVEEEVEVVSEDEKTEVEKKEESKETPKEEKDSKKTETKEEAKEDKTEKESKETKETPVAKKDDKKEDSKKE